MPYSYLFKYIIIGDQSVGKSCILMQFIDGEFKQDCDSTIGVEFGSKNITCRNQIIKLQIWDTAGQQTFRSITRSYFRGTVGVLLVYDVTSYKSFQSVNQWVEEVSNYATNEHYQIFLIGNKTDLEENRQVSYEEGENYANQKNISFLESSAKNGYNTSEVFHMLTEKILERIQKGEIDIKDQNGGVKLGDYAPKQATVHEKSKCC